MKFVFFVEKFCIVVGMMCNKRKFKRYFLLFEIILFVYIILKMESLFFK